MQPDRHQLFRLGIRQRLEQNAVDHGKDRGVGADADSQREKDGDAESGRFAQAPQSEFQVSKEGFKPGPLPDLAAPCLDEGGISERTKGCLACLSSREVLQAHQLLSLLFEVFTHFFAQFVVKLSAAEDSL